MTVSPRLRGLAAAAALSLTTSACCDLALYLCGPDRSRWVSVSYATADQALATFLEAVRRDARQVVYESLAEDLKNRLGIPGALELEVMWRKLEEEVPGIHLLGTARVLRREQLAPDHVRFLLERSGRTFTIDTRRSAFVALAYDLDGRRQESSDYVDSLPSYVSIDVRHGAPTVVLGVPALALPDVVEVADLLSVTAGMTWRIDGFSTSAEDSVP